MPKPQHTEIVCIIDRSGSMQGLQESAIAGFNQFLVSQQRLPGTASLSLILFNHLYDHVSSNVPLDAVQPLTRFTYAPNGNTALLDAVGMTIDSVGRRLAMTPEPERPEKVLVCILTDGLENSSRHYQRPQVKSMIEHQREKYSWEFVYLAAGKDVFDEAQDFGIDPNMIKEVHRTTVGMGRAFHAMDEAAYVCRKASVDTELLKVSPDA
jgi:uncharacterized protein YegL